MKTSHAQQIRLGIIFARLDYEPRRVKRWQTPAVTRHGIRGYWVLRTLEQHAYERERFSCRLRVIRGA